MELHTIGIDLGKPVFHLVGLNVHGEVVVRKKFSRTRLLHFTANRHIGLIGKEDRRLATLTSPDAGQFRALAALPQRGSLRGGVPASG